MLAAIRPYDANIYFKNCTLKNQVKKSVYSLLRQIMLLIFYVNMIF